MSSQGSSLALMLEYPAFEFSPAQHAGLVKMWTKYGKGHSLWPYNKEFHTNLLRKMSDADVLYRANAGIPSYSDLAREVAYERGLMEIQRNV